jgi:small subunit ribosomal protein S8
MTMTDPISDMLTRIRNAVQASHENVDIPSSKVKLAIAKVLKAEGYIRNFKPIAEGNRLKIRILLKYDERGRPIISGVQRVSKPSCRVYRRADAVEKVLNGYGIHILTTSRGVMTDRRARSMNVGGEVLCAVW